MTSLDLKSRPFSQGSKYRIIKHTGIQGFRFSVREEEDRSKLVSKSYLQPIDKTGVEIRGMTLLDFFQFCVED